MFLRWCFVVLEYEEEWWVGLGFLCVVVLEYGFFGGDLGCFSLGGRIWK